MRRESWVIAPENILGRAVRCGLISAADAESETYLRAALETAEDIRDSWPEGEGFGSSDGTYAMEDMLNRAGRKTAYVEGRLTVVA